MFPQFAPVAEAACQVGSLASVLAALTPDLTLFVGQLVNPDTSTFKWGEGRTEALVAELTRRDFVREVY
ncbi:MAG: hypothetical protein OXM87_04765 [Truepera sp.]|nr:hypothetical protein [Truepera sp.]